MTYTKKIHSKVCKKCNKPFETGFKMAFYCSRKCQKENYNEEYKRTSSYPNLSTGTVGALTELFIATYFLERGYEVYRALSPSCGADIVICKDGITKRLECRTGYRTNKTKRIVYPTNTKHEVDLFAVYIAHDKDIILFLPDHITRYELN